MPVLPGVLDPSRAEGWPNKGRTACPRQLNTDPTGFSGASKRGVEIDRRGVVDRIIGDATASELVLCAYINWNATEAVGIPCSHPPQIKTHADKHSQIRASIATDASYLWSRY